MELGGDIVEHHGGEYLVHPEPGLQYAGDRAPEGAAQGAREQHEGQQQPFRKVRQGEGHGRGRQDSDLHLALGADVEDARAEGYRDAQAHQDQRHGPHEDLRDPVHVLEGLREDDPVGLGDAHADRRQHQGADPDRRRGRRQDYGRRIEGLVGPVHAVAPSPPRSPAIRAPSRARVASGAGSVARILPL